MIQLPIEIGDTILAGRFKNKKIVVKEIGTDQYGLPTVNGRGILKIRIEKLIDKDKKMSKESKVSNKKLVREQSEEKTFDFGRSIPVKIKKDGDRYCIYRVNQPDGSETKALNNGFETEDLAERAARLRGFVLIDDKGNVKGYESDKQPTKLKTTEEKVEYVTEIVQRILIESESLVSTIKDVDLYSWEVVQRLAAKQGYNLMSYAKKSIPTAGSPTVDIEKVKLNPDVTVLKVWKDKDGNILIKSSVAYLKFWKGNYGGSKLKTSESKVSKKKIIKESLDPKIDKAINELAELEKQLAAATAKIDALKKELDVSGMEKRYKQIVDSELWDFLEQMKKDEERVTRASNVLLTIKRYQTEKATYEYEKVLDFAMTQVNQDVKEKILMELKATEKISRVKPSLSFSKAEGKITEANVFTKIVDWMKSFFTGLNAKLRSKGQNIDKNLEKLERALKIHGQ